MSKSSRTPSAEPSKTRAQKKGSLAEQVARLAGVSPSAVSRTFTAGARVSDETREKVLSAARKLNYRPARSIQTPHLRRSHIVGVAVAELDDLFYARAAAQLFDGLNTIGYRPLVFVTHGQWHTVYQQLLSLRVDALILLSAQGALSLADECRQFGIPLVLAFDAKMTDGFTSVSGTNFLGGQDVGSFLVAGGHRRFAFMGGADSSMEQEREAGFNAAIAAAGLPRPQRVRGWYHFEQVAAATRQLLSANTRPDAIFCVNDQTAITCLEIARSEFKLHPGKDVSIVGFDDVPAAAWPSLDLTTYSQPVVRVVDRTIALLRRLLDGEQLNGVHEVIPGQLMVRGSARVPIKGVRTNAEGQRFWVNEAAQNGPPVLEPAVLAEAANTHRSSRSS